MATLTVPSIGYPAGSPLGLVGVNIVPPGAPGYGQAVDIRPGTSITATLFDPQNPVYAAMVAAGRLVIS